MLRYYEPFRLGVIDVLKQHYGAAKANEFTEALKNNWVVDFQNADFPRSDGSHNIPFFSKLTLREEARNIKAMGFDVQVNFITLTHIN